jgi:uncharacterized membrane protein
MPRLAFLDALRGLALIFMVVNHTARDWLGTVMTWPRYHLIYGSMVFPAAIFLFLVGFCLPLAPRPARYYARRGLEIMAAGWLVNVLVNTRHAVWASGVLHTIGLSIMLLGAALPFARRGWVRAAMLAVAVGGYALFATSLPALAAWSKAHPTAAEVIFHDFPAWPWMAAAIIGLVAGSMWLDARGRGPDAEARFFLWTAAIGLLAAIVSVAWEASGPSLFGFRRDFTLNNYWIPRGVTLPLIGAGVATFLAASYRWVAIRGHAWPWLLTLGKNALMLYVVHQIIEATIVEKWLGVAFHSWLAYTAANLAFLVLLVYVARAWIAVKARLGAR